MLKSQKALLDVDGASDTTALTKLTISMKMSLETATNSLKVTKPAVHDLFILIGLFP